MRLSTELLYMVHRLQNERHALNALLRPPGILELSSLQENQLPSRASKQQHTAFVSIESQQIDTSFLDPDQKALTSILISEGTSQGQAKDQQPRSDSIRASHLPALSSLQISSRLSHITRRLAPTLDSFASGVHDIELYRSAADNVSSRILQVCSRRLEERDLWNALADEEREQERSGVSKDRKIVKNPVRLRKEVHKEDIGLVLGALSRVERR
jgi:kinetochore protein Mis13/DSN1